MGGVVSALFGELVHLIMNITVLLCNWIFELIDSTELSDTQITSTFSILDNISDAFVTIGFALALVILFVSLFQYLFPYLDIDMGDEHPIQSIVRFGLALLLVFEFKKFFNDVIFKNGISVIFSYFNDELGTQNVLSYFKNNILNTLQSFFGNAIDYIVNFIIAILFMGMFLINAFKFCVYHFEKMFLTQLLIYLSPAACATIASKKTSTVFKSYMNLLTTNCVCLIMNILIVKLVANGLTNIESSAFSSLFSSTTAINNLTSSIAFAQTRQFVVGMMLLTAALKVGKKMSVYVGSLFQVNGMSDSIRDGLGALGYATAGVFAVSRMAKYNKAEKREAESDKKIEDTLKDIKDGNNSLPEPNNNDSSDDEPNPNTKTQEKDNDTEVEWTPADDSSQSNDTEKQDGTNTEGLNNQNGIGQENNGDGKDTENAQTNEANFKSPDVFNQNGISGEGQSTDNAQTPDLNQNNEEKTNDTIVSGAGGTEPSSVDPSVANGVTSGSTGFAENTEGSDSRKGSSSNQTSNAKKTNQSDVSSTGGVSGTSGNNVSSNTASSSINNSIALNATPNNGGGSITGSGQNTSPASNSSSVESSFDSSSNTNRSGVGNSTTEYHSSSTNNTYNTEEKQPKNQSANDANEDASNNFGNGNGNIRTT